MNPRQPCTPLHQVLRVYPSSKLLLAAPSNDAADLLALRLLGAGRPKSEILRINAYQRGKEALHEKLMDVSTWDDGDGAFRLPERGEIERKRVVVVTCLMAAKVWEEVVCNVMAAEWLVMTAVVSSNDRRMVHPVCCGQGGS